METLIIHPQSEEQSEAIISVLKAMKIPFHKSPYDPEFVKKIMESEAHPDGAIILNCEEDISNYLNKPGADVQD